jgi:hypothetical protein
MHQGSPAFIIESSATFIANAAKLPFFSARVALNATGAFPRFGAGRGFCPAIVAGG